MDFPQTILPFSLPCLPDHGHAVLSISPTCLLDCTQAISPFSLPRLHEYSLAVTATNACQAESHSGQAVSTIGYNPETFRSLNTLSPFLLPHPPDCNGTACPNPVVDLSEAVCLFSLLCPSNNGPVFQSSHNLLKQLLICSVAWGAHCILGFPAAPVLCCTMVLSVAMAIVAFPLSHCLLWSLKTIGQPCQLPWPLSSYLAVHAMLCTCLPGLLG
jgi:hypothetical protein